MEILLVVWTIVKWIFIVLLALLTLLVLILFLALFVPVCYEASGRGIKEYSLTARVHWLFRLLRVFISFSEQDGLAASVKILWFTVFRLEAEEEEEEPKADAHTLAPVRKPLPEQNAKEAENRAEKENAKPGRAEEKKQKARPEETQDEKPCDEHGKRKLEGSAETKEERRFQEEKKPLPEKKAAKRPERQAEGWEADLEDTKEPPDAKEMERPVVRRVKLSEIEETSFEKEEQAEERGSQKKGRAGKDEPEEAEGRKEAKDGKTAEERLDAAYFLHMPWEEKKRLLFLAKRFLKKLMRQCLPRRLCIRARVGTGDPALTGEVLGLFGILRAAFGSSVSVTGDFNKAALAGDFSLYGKIRLGMIAGACIQLLFQKPVWKLIKLYRKG